MTLDEPINEDLIRDVISTIFKDLKFNPDIRIDKGSKIGEGFLGITSSVQVKIGEETKQFFIKSISQNEKLRRVLSLEMVFKREACFYSELHQILSDICKKYLKKSFDVTPRCFLVKTDYLKEAIVFDNINTHGFSTSTETNLDKNHLMMALKKYSYLHACGFLFKKDNPSKFHHMEKSNPDLFFKVLSIYDLNRLKLFCLEILRKHCSDVDDKDILQKFSEIKTRTLEVGNCVSKIDEYSTITHIDCWKNNLMFKYKDNSNEVEDLKIIDMQMWTVNSPVMDILHLIYTNISSHETLDLLDYYFNYYYQSLSNTILEMNENIEVMYPRNIYLAHLKKHSFYGFFMAVLVLRALLSNDKEIPNLAEMILQDKPLNEAFIYNLSDEEEYCNRLKTILKHFIKNDIL